MRAGFLEDPDGEPEVGSAEPATGPSDQEVKLECLRLAIENPMFGRDAVEYARKMYEFVIETD